MKATKKINSKRLLSRSELLGTDKQGNGTGANHKDKLPAMDFVLRRLSRRYPTSKVLNILSTELPEAFRLAEVVGKWVWVRFGEVPALETRHRLAQFGFHWNRQRKAWQHPCGKFCLGSDADPRIKYQSYFVADVKPV
jgi:hypothetical protein